MMSKTLVIFHHNNGHSKVIKVRNGEKITNQYNQVPHLTKDITWEKQTHTQLNIINKGQDVSLFPAGNHKAAILFKRLYDKQSLTLMVTI